MKVLLAPILESALGHPSGLDSFFFLLLKHFLDLRISIGRNIFVKAENVSAFTSHHFFLFGFPSFDAV